MIPILCVNIEEPDEPEANASLIRIVDEYANKIENARRAIERFRRNIYRGVLFCTNSACLMMILLTRAPTFQERFQMLTAIIKLFLFKPDSSQGLAQRVLNTTTKDCDSPDVRDRTYIYWHLISADPGVAKVQVQFLDYRSSYSFRVILLRQSVILGTSATDNLTSYNCCACATQRAN